MDANLDSRVGSYYGHAVRRFVTADIEALAKRLEEEREIAKFGSKKAYNEHKRQEKKRKAAEERQKRAEEKLEERKKELADKYVTIMEIGKSSGQCIPDSIDELKFNKTSAKTTWALKDPDLTKLDAVKVGRSLMYAAIDVINAAEEKHTESWHKQVPQLKFAPLVCRVNTAVKLDSERKAVYACYLMLKLELEVSENGTDIDADARAMAIRTLQDKVTQSSRRVEVANKELSDNQTLLASFYTTFSEPMPQSIQDGELELSTTNDTQAGSQGEPPRKVAKVHPQSSSA